MHDNKKVIIVAIVNQVYLKEKGCLHCMQTFFVSVQSVILLIAYSINAHCNVEISDDKELINFYFCYVLSFKCVNSKNYFM